MPMTSKSSGLNSAWSKAPIFSQASRQPSSAPSHIMRRKLSGPTGSGNTSPTLARVHTGKRVLSPLPTTHGATDMTDPLIVVTVTLPKGAASVATRSGEWARSHCGPPRRHPPSGRMPAGLISPRRGGHVASIGRGAGPGRKHSSARKAR